MPGKLKFSGLKMEQSENTASDQRLEDCEARHAAVRLCFLDIKTGKNIDIMYFSAHPQIAVDTSAADYSGDFYADIRC